MRGQGAGSLEDGDDETGSRRGSGGAAAVGPGGGLRPGARPGPAASQVISSGNPVLADLQRPPAGQGCEATATSGAVQVLLRAAWSCEPRGS